MKVQPFGHMKEKLAFDFVIMHNIQSYRGRENKVHKRDCD